MNRTYGSYENYAYYVEYNAHGKHGKVGLVDIISGDRYSVGIDKALCIEIACHGLSENKVLIIRRIASEQETIRWLAITIAIIVAGNWYFYFTRV